MSYLVGPGHRVVPFKEHRKPFVCIDDLVVPAGSVGVEEPGWRELDFGNRVELRLDDDPEAVSVDRFEDVCHVAVVVPGFTGEPIFDAVMFSVIAKGVQSFGGLGTRP